jgi:uncharacterized Zn-binding protein involved in type VI secretion
MTPEQIRTLALQLYAVIFDSDGVAALTTWQRCLRACRRWTLEPATAMLISEALTDYIYDGTRPRLTGATPLAKAQAVLRQAIGAADDGDPAACPARTRLTPSAIAAMIGWVLVAGPHPIHAGRSR